MYSVCTGPIGWQFIAGIGWELLSRTYAETGRPLPKASGGSRHLSVDIPIFAAVADDAVVDAGVQILFHAMVATASYVNRVWELQSTKAGLQMVNKKILIDTTGDANVGEVAGFDLVRSEVVQPATLTFSCSGFEPDALDYDALNHAADKAVAAGDLLRGDISWNNDMAQKRCCRSAVLMQTTFVSAVQKTAAADRMPKLPDVRRCCACTASCAGSRD